MLFSWDENRRVGMGPNSDAPIGSNFYGDVSPLGLYFYTMPYHLDDGPTLVNSIQKREVACQKR
ncbi:hypothetical protein BC792_12373 [Sphingobacterium allocomposti]|uniref:Uncharacterized protein n=1 Tax=Sphingobacterium allocomposti TaxID=415956 RepID=A0A5S5D5Q3_9SPHI|nr:hypothetical protein BC792_12373 [Sphingobacterium composti Yoo et al. 2007 non Ten et al. 2007]